MAIVKEAPKKISDAEAAQNKAILDGLDSDKKKKDVMLMNIEALEKHTLYLRKINGDLTLEYESRKKLVDSLNDGVAGAQAQLNMLKGLFDKKNAELLKDVTKRQADIEAADKTLRALILENKASKNNNDIEKSKLEEHRRLCDAQMFEMKRALDQNNSEWSKREADILLREENLKLEIKKFEEEKTSLAPEAARISSIKNENILLIQRIEQDKNDVANLRLSIDSERQRMQETQASLSQRTKQKEVALANEEARLRKWDQDLKDYDLEVSAKLVEANKILHREQLQNKISDKK